MPKVDKSKKPVFDHDCTACEYLGRLAGFSPHEGEPQFFDVYRCPGSVLGPSYIARFGNKGFEYWSMPYDILKTVPTEPLGQTTRLLRAMKTIAVAHETGHTTPTIEEAAQEMYDFIKEASEESDEKRWAATFRGIDHLKQRWKRSLGNDKT